MTSRYRYGTGATARSDHPDFSPSSILTHSGIEFDLLNPSTWTFDLNDIAHSLSRQCRFIGHVEFYSVAEHSLRVSSMLRDWGESPAVQLVGLMHDAVETYIGDIPGPWKPFVSIDGRPIQELERDIESLLMQEFGLLTEYDNDWGVVKRADHEVYKLEAAARPFIGRLSPGQAYSAFLLAFQDLSDSAYSARTSRPAGQLARA